MPRQLPRMLMAELRKLLSRGVGQVGLIVAVLIAAAAVGALYVWREAQGGVTVNGQPGASFVRFEVATGLDWSLRARNFFVMPLILLTLTAQSLAGEWQERTLRSLVLRPVPRWSVLAAKAGALWSWSFLTIALTYATALGASALLFEQTLPISGVSIGFLATSLSDLGLICIGLLVGTALQSVPAVIVATLLFLMADRALALALSGATLVGVQGASAVHELLPGTALGAWSGYAEGWSESAFFGLALLLIFTSALTLWRFQRADVP